MCPQFAAGYFFASGHPKIFDQTVKMIFHNFCDTVSTAVVEGQPGQTAETVDRRACPHFKSAAMPRECATMPDSANLQPAKLQADEMRACRMSFAANRQLKCQRECQRECLFGANPRMMVGAQVRHRMTADWKHGHPDG
jgi:hypothetical protein